MKAKSFSRIGLVLFSFASVVALSVSSQAQTIVAEDDADTYPGEPDHGWPAYNGGFGYGSWTPLADTGGGGTYMEGVGVNGRQTGPGNYSFALYAGSGSYDISRPLDSSISDGIFTVATRFDVAGAGPNLVNIRAGNNTSSFGSGELLSFGIVNGNELSYTDGSGFHVLPSGEARGDVWDWTVDFNAAAGTYNLAVTEQGGGYSADVSGSLEANGSSVGSFAVINSSTGNNQNVIFDYPEFESIPEPSTLALAAMGLAGLFSFRHRK
ncbi:MAG: PEP-CTERM sorting domain-containing protein [Limisphaerales bacterium]